MISDVFRIAENGGACVAFETNPMYGLKKSFINKIIGHFRIEPVQIKKIIVQNDSICAKMF